MTREFAELDVFREGCALVERLVRAGHAAYFVGGAPRDMLLGKKPKDIDVATSATPDQVVKLFPGSRLVGACFGVILVTLPGASVSFEVATFREERGYEDGRHPESVRYTTDPKRDASRRDFTVNGLFYDPLKDRFLDCVGGRSDLDRGVLRTIGEPAERFSEDYLRILRAFRFAARFGLRFEERTEKAIRALGDRVLHLSAERIKGELESVLVGPNAARAIRMMAETGLLRILLPDVDATRDVPQPERFHPEGDVFVHTMLMLDHMVAPSVELAWSVLLHDVGKPPTLTRDADGIEHFYRHNAIGGELAGALMRHLKCSNASIRTVTTAVRRHMSFAHVQEMKPSKIRRLISESSFPLELELHRLDCLCSHGKMGNFIFLLDRLREMGDEPELPDPFINGKDLIALGMTPGPRFGRILDQVRTSQLDGEITSRGEALRKVEALLVSAGETG